MNEPLRAFIFVQYAAHCDTDAGCFIATLWKSSVQLKVYHLGEAVSRVMGNIMMLYNHYLYQWMLCCLFFFPLKLCTFTAFTNPFEFCASLHNHLIWKPSRLMCLHALAHKWPNIMTNASWKCEEGNFMRRGIKEHCATGICIKRKYYNILLNIWNHCCLIHWFCVFMHCAFFHLYPRRSFPRTASFLN